MARHLGHNLDIGAIAFLVALNGLSSVIHGLELLTIGRSMESIVSFAIALALLHRSYGVWQRSYTAYMVTLILLVIRASLALVSILAATFATESTFSLFLAFAAILYMAQPRVRAKFART